MSEVKKNFMADLTELQEVERKKAELAKKKLQVEERRIEAQIEKIAENDRNLELAKNAKYGVLSPEQIEEIRKANAEYMHAARTKMRFINKEFDNVVPFFRKNLIFIGAKTGEGKSTAVGAITREVISQYKDEAKTKRRRVLIITNEEKKEDVYNRITCQIMGWHYANHDQFTEHQLKTFDQMFAVLAPLVTVIDDAHTGGIGATTTPEGLQIIFEGLLRDQEFYDTILIDYYQNYTWSQKDHTMNEWQVQSRVASLLDKYKNIYPAPIVIFGQVQPDSEENPKPFEFRIKGRKQIIVPATMVMEMVARREDLMTEWFVHKSRFNEYVGKSVKTGFDQGQFVAYDEAWRTKVNEIKEKRARRELEKQSGIKFDKKEPENGTEPEGS